MTRKRKLLKKSGLYLVTDRKVLKQRDLLRILSRSLKAGLDMIQLRDKEASTLELLETGRAIKKLLKNKTVLFIINDRVDLAIALDADGVHLGRKDMPVEIARNILGRKKIIGVSARSVKEAIELAKKDVDYIAIGAIFRTPIKPDYKAVGVNAVRKIAKQIKTPLIAIGGINESNIETVVRAGARRIAVVREILCAKDPGLATKNLLKKMKAL